MDEKLLKDMARKQRIVSEVLRLRALHGVKLRQPLSELTINSAAELLPEVAELIKASVNVKKVSFGGISLEDSKDLVRSAEDFPIPLALNIALTPELEAEGMGREVIRHGQMLRREAGYALDDSIRLILLTEDKGLQAILQSQSDVFMVALQAVDILDSGEEDKGQDVSLGGASLHIGVKKV